VDRGSAPKRHDVSVVVVNHNGRQDLPGLLGSLSCQVRPPDEVLIVDNASSDGSVEYVRQHFPSVRVIALPENVGFAQGNNEGLAHARGDYIALVNPDTTVDERWLAELIHTIELDPDIAAAVPKIYRASEPAIIEQAGAQFNNLGHCWTRGFNQLDTGQFDTTTEVPALTGCSVLLRRDALHGEPLFDRSLFMYYEEFELSIRLRGRGYKVMYAPNAVVYHKGMQSMQRTTRRSNLMQQFYCNRNRLKILFKYYPIASLVRNSPMIILSLAYWDAVFLRDAGPRFLLRAVAAQMRYAVHGLRERHLGSDLESEQWLPWMTRQKVRDVMNLRAARGEA
jgi:GT2 family glycosyltransferase